MNKGTRQKVTWGAREQGHKRTRGEENKRTRGLREKGRREQGKQEQGDVEKLT